MFYGQSPQWVIVTTVVGLCSPNWLGAPHTVSSLPGCHSNSVTGVTVPMYRCPLTPITTQGRHSLFFCCLIGQQGNVTSSSLISGFDESLQMLFEHLLHVGFI